MGDTPLAGATPVVTTNVPGPGYVWRRVDTKVPTASALRAEDDPFDEAKRLWHYRDRILARLSRVEGRSRMGRDEVMVVRNRLHARRLIIECNLVAFAICGVVVRRSELAKLDAWSDLDGAGLAPEARDVESPRHDANDERDGSPSSPSRIHHAVSHAPAPFISALDAFRGLLRDAAREVVDEVVPTILERSLPKIVAEVRSVLEQDDRRQAAAVFVTIKRAARIMDAHPATVRKLMREGKLGRYSVESQPRVKVSDIHAYMAREGRASPTISLDERARHLLGR